MERSRHVADGEDEGRLHRLVRVIAPAARRGPLAGEDREPRPVVVAGLDVLGENLEPVESGNARRRDGARPPLPLFRDHPRRAGGVVGRHDLPVARPQEFVCLGERLGVAVDPLDPVERLARQGDEGQPNRHADLADDPHAPVVELREEVVRLPDRPAERTLDRDDRRAGLARGNRLEDRAPRRDGGRLGRLTEVRENGLLAEGARLALVRDLSLVRDLY